MAEKLTLAESERRVWNMVRAELQSELSQLLRGLEQERSDKARVVSYRKHSRSCKKSLAV
jgi:hypothetical protein